MLNSDINSRDIFLDGYKALLRWIWIFGGTMVLLGLLIFLFPALIGFMIAGVILFVGMVALYWGYHVWKFRKHMDHLEVSREPFFAEMDFEQPRYYHRKIHIVVK